MVAKRRSPGPSGSPNHSAGRPKKLRCAIYTRKSTAAGLEKDFNSLDAQAEACAAYVRSRSLEGWALVPEVYADGGFTGANTERPAFRRLLEDVAAGRVDVVVVYKVDRLSRSLVDFAQVMAHFQRAGVAFVSITQAFSTADPVGRLTLNMLMSFAEFEREMITARIRDKVSAARGRGKWTGGKVPFGYAVVDRRLVVQEAEAPWVRDLFSGYLEGSTALALAERLNDAGVPMKAAQVPRPRPWTQGIVLRILKNRLYLGEIRCEDVFVPAEHPALVDPEVFEAVQQRLEPAARASRRQSLNPTYLLRGTLRCAACGVPMTSASTHRNGRLFRYYRCTTRNQRGQRACSTRQLPCEALEAFVVARVREALADPVLSAVVVGLLPDLAGMMQRGFEALWEVLTLPSRQRLVRLVMAAVIVDEASGRLALEFRDPAAMAEAVA